MEVVGRAFNGEEALLVAPPARPDIVLMDTCMPVMDGIIATGRLSKIPGWTVAVVMMSIQGDQDYLRRALLAGAREYLVKPFSADELINAIRHVYALQKAEGAVPNSEESRELLLASPLSRNSASSFTRTLGMNTVVHVSVSALRAIRAG